MNRRIITLLVALVPVVLLGVIGSVYTVPFVALGPGPTHDTLGEYEGREIVGVTGAEVDRTAGHLNMTTIAMRDGLTLFEALGFWVSGRHGIVPRAEVYPPGLTREEVDKSNEEEFSTSESNAEVAAMRQLNLPTAVLVHEVGDKAPAHEVLRPDDQIVSVNGTPISTPQDVVAEVSNKAPGTVLSMVIRRDGAEQTVNVTLGARPDDETKGYLGLTTTEAAAPPMQVEFYLPDIGGPSAGLMFSLALVEKLSPGDLDGGSFVAGTGTIDENGKVGAIGGIQYKMMAARDAGAETFLVPAGNCAEAIQRVPEGLRLVRVETLAGAVQALEDISAGGAAPSCG
ncbi:PDZ domain-containing protein [Nocardia sp. NPDC051750]|uniref:PDZ domain-containing protein n=1 Tax=Nocardia sp. NPDC051750 TaxID=3364325 RepID=UPI0037A98CC5